MACRMKPRYGPASVVLALSCCILQSIAESTDVSPQHSTKTSGDLFDWLKGHGAEVRSCALSASSMSYHLRNRFNNNLGGKDHRDAIAD